jgi:hypothetical protein
LKNVINLRALSEPCSFFHWYFLILSTLSLFFGRLSE